MALQSSSGSALSGYLNYAQQAAAQNNAYSAQQAMNQMNFQSREAAIARQFNSDEARLNREWQEYMSSTAHQRQVRDLMAAGLNPILSATGGAPVTSGATASQSSSPQGSKGETDTSLAQAFASILGSVISAQSSMLNTATSAKASEQIAELQSETDLMKSVMSARSADNVARINQQTSLNVASINASATRDAAAIHGAATRAAAEISGQYHLSATRETALSNIIQTNLNNLTKQKINDKQIVSSEKLAELNRDLQRDLQKQGFDFDLVLQQDRQSHEFKLKMADDVVNGLFGLGRSAIAANGQIKSSLIRSLLG